MMMAMIWGVGDQGNCAAIGPDTPHRNCWGGLSCLSFHLASFDYGGDPSVQPPKFGEATLFYSTLNSEIRLPHTNFSKFYTIQICVVTVEGRSNVGTMCVLWTSALVHGLGFLENGKVDQSIVVNFPIPLL